MKIIVRVENKYGNQMIYPVCEKAKLFAELVRQKTLTQGDIGKIKLLGYEIVVERPEVKL